MLEVTGFSDDGIILEGDLIEQFDRYDSKGDYLAFSDGTLLKALYDENGIWRFTVCFKGPLFSEKIEGDVETDTNDKIRFIPGVKWCICGKDIATMAQLHSLAGG